MAITLDFNVRSGDPSPIDRIRQAIAETQKQTGTLDTVMKAWISTLQASLEKGRTLNQALGDVARTFKNTSSEASFFSNVLKQNIRDMKDLESAAQRVQNRFSVGLPGGSFGGGGGGSRFSVGLPGGGFGGAAIPNSRAAQALGVFGGRIFGIEALGALGIPGGGFAASQLLRSLNLSGGAALGLGGGAVGALLLAELAKLGAQAGTYGQTQTNLSAEYGVGVGATQRLGAIGGIAGINPQSIFGSLRRLTEQGGTRRTNSLLGDIGLSSGVAFESPDKQLSDVAHALQRITDEGERARVAVGLFGEEGRKLLPLVDTFDKINGSVRDFGLSKEQIANLNDYRIQLNELKLSWESLKLSLGQGAVATINFVTGGNIPGTLGAILKGAPGGIAGIGIAGANVAGARAGAFLNPGTGLSDFEGLGARSPQAGILSGRGIIGSQRNSILGSVRAGTLSPLDSARTSLQDAIEARGDAENKFRAGSFLPSQSDIRSLSSAYSGVQNAENAVKAAEQMDKFLKLPAPQDRQDVLKYLNTLKNSGEYDLIRGTPAFKRYFTYLTRTAISEAGQPSEQLHNIAVKFGSTEDILTKLAKEKSSDTSGETQVVREGLRGQLEQLQGQYGVNEANLRLGAAVSEGGLVGQQYRLTSTQFAALQLAKSQSVTGRGDSARRALLLGQFNAQSDAAGAFPVGPEKEAAISKSYEILQQIAALDIDTKTKGVEALNKFNEAVAKSAEEIERQFSSGVAGIILGAQSGGGKGARGAALSFATGQEKKIIENIIGAVYRSGGIQSALGGIGGVLGSTFSKGTIFEDPGKPLAANTTALNRLTDKIGMVSSGVSYGGEAGGFLAPGGLGGSGNGGMFTNFPTPIIGADGTVSYINSATQALSSASSAIAGGTSTPSLIKDATSALTAIGRAIGGKGFISSGYGLDAAEIGGGALAIYNGARTGGARGGLQVAGGSALAGAGAITAIDQFSGLFGALGSTLSTILPGIGAVLPLISTFLGDPKQQRTQQISKSIFTSTYLAPASISLSQGANAGYTDVDINGNVRASNYSPYPVNSLPYLDVPRRTAVPGHTSGSFGGTGNGPPSAQNPPASYTLNVQALDSKSIIDHATAITDAVHAGINSGFHPIIRDLANKMGVNS